MGLFDVHAHLTHRRLAGRIDEVISNAAAAGLTSIISNGLKPTDNAAVARLAGEHSMVKPAFGFYPVETVLGAMRDAGVEYPSDEEAVDPDEAVDWVRQHVSECVAVGEIGLDGYWVPEPFWESQENIFRQMVQIALDADKPMIVHSRKREARAFEILQEMGATRVNWHCFGGRVKLARRIAEHGHFLSIPANARRSESFTRMLETLPREQLLLETDCPYLSPERGVDNEPHNVEGTLRYASELWDEAEDIVLTRLSQNFERLFGFAP